MQPQRLELATFPLSCIFLRFDRKSASVGGVQQDKYLLVGRFCCHENWICGWLGNPSGGTADAPEANSKTVSSVIGPASSSVGHQVELLSDMMNLISLLLYLVHKNSLFFMTKLQNTNLQYQSTSLSRSILSGFLEIFYCCLAWRSPR